MTLDDTFINYDSLLQIVPKNIPSLLSVARSEFHKTENYSGRSYRFVVLYCQGTLRHKFFLE